MWKQEITAIKTSNDSHLSWKNLFYKNQFYFRIYAGLDSDNYIDSFGIGDETTNVFIQNPVCNGYYIVYEVVLFYRVAIMNLLWDTIM